MNESVFVERGGEGDGQVSHYCVRSQSRSRSRSCPRSRGRSKSQVKDTGHMLSRDPGSGGSGQSSSSLSSKVDLFNELKQLLQSKGLEDSLSVVKRALLTQQVKYSKK